MANEEDATRNAGRKSSRWDEFDCPECSAHNPWPNEFTIGEEVFCQWCGQTFVTKKAGELGDRFKLVSV